ncbi:MAG: 2Fe-2S iron-sulfur cluster-binding protein, partial [Spirochaetota bacterium]
MRPTIRIVSDGGSAEIETREGQTLLETLQRAGWHVPAPCGGDGRCGKCLVRVAPPAAAGPRDDAESRFTGPD